MAKLEEMFAETISAVNYSNGVVRVFFSGQDLESLVTDNGEGSPSAEHRFCVTMTLPGFLYAISVVQNFVENDKFKEMLEKAVAAGLLPPAEELEAAE